MPPADHAIFLEGPIGVGKSTLGRALSERLGAAFVEGDSYQPDDRPWFTASLSICRSVAADVLAHHAMGRASVVAYPLRCREWIWYCRTLGAAGIETLFVSLHATHEEIVDPTRGRSFTEWERARIAEMIGQGYGRRSFAQLRIDTGRSDAPAALERLVDALNRRPGTR